MAVATQVQEKPAEGGRPALSSKARELMEELNTDADEVACLGPHPDELAGAAPLVHRHRRHVGRRPDGLRPRRRQPDEERRPPLALERIQPVPRPHRRDRRQGRRLADRVRRPAERSCSPIPASTAACRSPTRSAARSRSTIRATSRPPTCTRPNASRTILSDKGGYTNVEGERCEAHRGDIILTPNGTWHDHGNEGDAPVIWIDMLDWPLMEFLDCAWVDQDFKPGDGSNAKSQATVAQERLFEPALRLGRHGADLRVAPGRLRPRSRAADPFPRHADPRDAASA